MVGWAYVIFGVTAAVVLVFMVCWRDRAVARHHDAPCAENISIYQQYGSVDAGAGSRKRSISGRNRCWILISSSVVAAQRWV
ncbi:hypothetical protein KCP74_19630 [Salmonella enterica subsp. enterica]|nr:hypothetical protein KCP74_19630 [Salmonella enterica subsp. enterica]